MRPKTILLVDDDPLALEVLSETLTDMNYDVITEESAAHALKLFAENPREFDVVVTDLMMPEMTGDSLSEHIHALRPDIPVLLVTEVPDRVPRERVVAAGIRKVLPKGMTTRELLAALQEALQP
jgi:CheY-like chemotaxis protein